MKLELGAEFLRTTANEETSDLHLILSIINFWKLDHVTSDSLYRLQIPYCGQTVRMTRIGMAPRPACDQFDR